MKEDIGKLLAVALSLGVLASIAAVGSFSSFAIRTDAQRSQIARSAEANCRDADTDCAYKDLPAQVRAATAAEHMAALTVWQVGLGGVGLLVGAATMAAAIAAAAFARDAARHTLKGAAVARAALRDSRRASREEAVRYQKQLEMTQASTQLAVATQRPWLKMSLDKITVTLEDYGAPQAGVAVTVNVTNVGKSPAVLRWRVEVGADLTRNNPMSHDLAARRAIASVRHHYPLNATSPRTIFPDDTEPFQNAVVGFLKPTPGSVELGTGRTYPPLPDTPGYVLIVSLGITYALPGGGEGHTRCAYLVKNPDESLLVPFEGERGDLELELLNYLSFAD